MRNIKGVISLLLLATCYYCSRAVVDTGSGIFSKKSESNGLNLAATYTFKPITTLTTNIHIDKCYTVFVHYQITLDRKNGTGFHSKLLINYFNAGSIVHAATQNYKTAVGFYMANLNPGHYKFEVHYMSSMDIRIQARLDWQTAILQVIWFEGAHAVSEGIKCYPTPTSTNAYNVWGPIRDLEAALFLPNKSVVLAVYQFSAEMSTYDHVDAALDVNGFHQQTSTSAKGDSLYNDLHGAWAGNAHDGIYYFHIQYRSPETFKFADCKYKYKNNKNLYAMRLPLICTNAITINPKSPLYLIDSNNWTETDLRYHMVLLKETFVIIMYQYSGDSARSYIAMRLSIESEPMKHTASLTGGNAALTNFGLWQGTLKKGVHRIAVEYRTPASNNIRVSPNLDWRHLQNYKIWPSKSLTIIKC